MNDLVKSKLLKMMKYLNVKTVSCVAPARLFEPDQVREVNTIEFNLSSPDQVGYHNNDIDFRNLQGYNNTVGTIAATPDVLAVLVSHIWVSVTEKATKEMLATATKDYLWKNHGIAWNLK